MTTTQDAQIDEPDQVAFGIIQFNIIWCKNQKPIQVQREIEREIKSHSQTASGCP